MEYFKNLKTKQLILIAAGFVAGIALYQFINGVYTGIKMALAH